MHSESELRAIADQALNLSKGFAAEVSLGSGSSALTRFGESVITQNVASQEVGLSVRLMKEGKMGKSSTGNVSPDGIARCVATAKAALAVAEVDKELLPLVKPQKYVKHDRWHQATNDLSPEDRADGVRRVVDAYKKESLQAAGIYSTEGGITAIANSEGLWAVHRATGAEFSVSAMAPDSSGWAEDGDWDITKLDVNGASERAMRKALLGRNPASIEPGAYTAIFEPAAVADFLLFLSWEALNGKAFVEGRSCFTGKVGEKVVGDNITIVDDPYHELTSGMPFDYEGMPRQKVSLIDRGIFQGTVHDRATGPKAGLRSTGHAMPQPDSSGPFPLNVVMAPGASSVDEMIGSTEYGVLITRLHYTNILDPMKMLLTGMTRDGFFLIERGKVTRGLKNMRFTDSVLRILSNVPVLSRHLSKTRTFWGGGGTVVPAMKVNGFVFSSKTEN